jgi:hypothetical protein
MVTDPRPPWAVPLSWEITAKALGGRPEALIRWGMFTDASSNPRTLQTSSIASDKQARGLGEAILYQASPLRQPFRELGVERNRSKTGHEKYHKRVENIAENAGGEDTVARVDPPASLTTNPAKTRVFTDSCTEPDKQTLLSNFL